MDGCVYQLLLLMLSLEELLERRVVPLLKTNADLWQVIKQDTAGLTSDLREVNFGV